MSNVSPEQFIKLLEHQQKEFKKLNKQVLEVGLVKGNNYSDGSSVIEVGYKHEFGIGVSRRSWLREPLLASKDLIKKYQSSVVNRISEGGKSQDALEIMGIQITNFLKGNFRDGFGGKWKANSSNTVTLKGGKSNPLVDSGILKNSITYNVE